MRFYIIFLLLAPVLVCAQNKKPWAGFGMEVNMMGGRIYKHTKNFRPPVPDISSAVEVNFVQQTYGKNEWEQRRGYPLYGIGISYTDYGSNEIFGKCFSIYPNLQLPIITGKKLEWTARAGFGLAWVTRRYQRAPTWDTLNNAVGSHINNYTLFASDLRYRFNHQLDFQIGVNFSHVSNGALRTPNLGINLMGAHVGFRYFPVTASPERITERTLVPLKNRWLAQLRLGMAGNEAAVPNGPFYPIYIVSAYASKRYRSKNKVFAGLDYSYHEHIYAFLRNNEISPGNERQQSWKSSVFVGNEFLLGSFGIHLQVGYYLKESYLRLEKMYQRIGCNMYISQSEIAAIKESFISIHLKTHKTQAEFAELGIGFGF